MRAEKIELCAKTAVISREYGETRPAQIRGGEIFFFVTVNRFQGVIPAKLIALESTKQHVSSDDAPAWFLIFFPDFFCCCLPVDPGKEHRTGKGRSATAAFCAGKRTCQTFGN